jgi:hypothetical protein
LGIGDWAQSPIPNPQSPIPNPQKNILIYKFYQKFVKKYLIYFYKILIIKIKFKFKSVQTSKIVLFGNKISIFFLKANILVISFSDFSSLTQNNFTFSFF